MKSIMLFLMFAMISFAGDIDTLKNKTFNIGWYFWMTDDGKAAYLSAPSGNGVAVWRFTDERKWQPIHNASAFDGYPAAGNEFQSVSYNGDRTSVSFSACYTCNDSSRMLSGKTFNIGWYFWMTDDGKAAYLSAPSGNGVAVWRFTDERKWQPIHNASAFDGYPSAGNEFQSVSYNNNRSTISFGIQSNRHLGYFDYCSVSGVYSPASAVLLDGSGQVKQTIETSRLSGKMEFSKDGHFKAYGQLDGNLIFSYDENIIWMDSNSMLTKDNATSFKKIYGVELGDSVVEIYEFFDKWIEKTAWKKTSQDTNCRVASQASKQVKLYSGVRTGAYEEGNSMRVMVDIAAEDLQNLTIRWEGARFSHPEWAHTVLYFDNPSDCKTVSVTVSNGLESKLKKFKVCAEYGFAGTIVDEGVNY